MPRLPWCNLTSPVVVTESSTTGIEDDVAQEHNTIERHQVIKAGDKSGWVRCATPNFDVWRHGEREVHVFYYEDGSVNSAQIIDHAARASSSITVPESCLAKVLQWLSAPVAVR